MQIQGQSKSKLLLLGLPTMISTCLVFWNIQNLGLSVWDEYYYTEGAKWFLGVQGGWFQIYEPPGFPLVISLFWRFFGLHDYVAIAASGIFAILTVALMTYMGVKIFGFAVGIVAPLLLSAMPLFLYYARFAMTDVPFTFFFSAAVLSSYLALKSGRRRDILFAGILIAVCTGIKYDGFMALLVPALYVVPLTLSKGTPRERVNVFVGNAKALLIMAVPVAVGFLAWFYVLGLPTGVSRHFFSRQIIHLLSPRILLAGFLKFRAIVLTSHSRQLGLSPFSGGLFYIQVLATWASIPVLIFAVVGLMRRNIRDDPELFASFWLVILFLAFSCIPGNFQRAMVPVLPPLALVSAIGTRKIVDMVRGNRWPLSSSMNFDRLLHLSIVFLILALAASPTFQAVSDNHSGYRQAGMILNAVTNGSTVYALSKPVIDFYHPVVLNLSAPINSTNLPPQGYLVVDYTAFLRGYLSESEIQTLVIQGRLSPVASIPAGTPQVSYLDDVSFSQVQQMNSTYTSIMIYQITNDTS
ncbi:MAG TPA: glycosyltransferase family 39 protein [Candidatus Bathyarchaeia archaeon]|nr:glycosyltransferase family 39 protein [Candidatus Bathyarchaeia archaeon]